MKSIVIAAGMLTLTALVTLPASASEEDPLQWTAVIPDELRVTLKGGGISGTFPLTPTETSCGRLSWDGVPDKDGAMSGGQCEITVQLVDKSVVLKEHTLASDKGIRSDIIAKTIVPTAKVPWTGKISQTSVSVFRVEPDKKSATEGSAIRLESNRDAATVMPRIRKAIEAGPTFEKISDILGEADMDIGSGIHIFIYRLSDGTSITVGTPDKKKVMYIEHANKRLFPIEAKQAAGPVITGPVAAEGPPDLIDKIRVVLPAGWEVGQPAGTPNITVTRKAAIPPGELTFKPIPSSPAFGEGSASHAKTNGIRVWFSLEPVRACSAAEYEQRKAHNAGIQAQLEPLRKKIEQIPFTPSAKPSLLSRTPRNEEEKSWLAEYADVSSKRLTLPTHHVDGTGFLVTLEQSYYGASITAATVRDEIDAVRKAIETVLVPYE